MKRRTIKERSSNDDMLIKQALEAAIKAKQLLDDAANTIRDARGETFLFARLDSHSMDLDDTIDDIKGILAERLDDTDDEYVPESRKRFGKKFVKESEEETEWFNEIGELVPPDWAIDEYGIDPDKSPLPDECVRACSHPGQVDNDVSAWVDELKFDQNFPVERARRWLREYGAWDEDELAEMDARELAEKALWIFASDISDGETYCIMDA